MLNHRTVTIIFVLLLLAVAAVVFLFNAPLWIFLIVIGLYVALEVYGSINLTTRYFLPVILKGSSASNAIALTFDDGPVPGKTEKILDILKARQVQAAFFLIGKNAKAHPQLVKRVHNEGHILGNHSYWHSKTFDLQSAKKISAELKETDQVIQNTAGVLPKFFRPPYGVTNPMVASAVVKGNYTTIGWSIRSFDTITKNRSTLMKRVTSVLEPGAVILFHDYCESTIEILPGLLDHIARLGLKIVRVDELLNEKPYV